MSDVTDAATQAEVADSLVGEETQEQVVEQQPEAEQQPEQEVSEQIVEQEQQPEQEELVEDWLPSEQDRTFSDEALLRYAQRYQKDEQWLSDPLNRQLLVDKLNTDIFVRQQQQFAEEQTVEQPEPEPTRTEPQLTREQYFQNLDRVIAERTDPEVAKSFHADFLRAFGVPDAEIAKTSPQQAMQFTHTASKYMLNLMNTFADDILGERLQDQVSKAYPGFSDMYSRSSHAMAWDKVRNSNSQFANLPAYGTKEFTSTLREAAQRVPEVAEMIDEADGKPMNQQQVGRWYAMLARIASGQNVNPQLLQQAAAAGAKNARRAEVRRAAGNLGSGQSKGASSTPGPSKWGQSNQDLFGEDVQEVYQRETGRI